MKQRPIVFDCSKVQAILAGSKTQFRRVIKPQPIVYGQNRIGKDYLAPTMSFVLFARTKCPYGTPGDRLWVREHFSYNPFVYKASTDIAEWDWHTWRSPMWMTKSMSRITLEIADVRVERLQDITPEDALSEGYKGYGTECATLDAFWEHWNTTNPKHPWILNPWVWVIEFRRKES